MNIGAPFLLAFVAALVLVPLSRYGARRLGLVAKPREDRWHTREIAMLGGVGIAASIAVAMLVFGKFSELGVLGGSRGADVPHRPRRRYLVAQTGDETGHRDRASPRASCTSGTT